MVVKSDGRSGSPIRPSASLGNYEGTSEQELPQNVYRLDGETGTSNLGRRRYQGPNGLAFSPDETKLYVVESRARRRTANPRLRRLDGGQAGATAAMFIDAGPGRPDGFRVDVDGNLWCGWGMGAPSSTACVIFNPDGQADRPHRAAGALRQSLLRRSRRNRLFMAASHSLYALYVNTQGVPGG